MKYKVYPSITTLYGDNWINKIAQVKELGITEACFFPTSLTVDSRKRAYELLESSGLQYIPLVHIRQDFTPEEMEYFMKRFNTGLFNMHSSRQYPPLHDLHKYKDFIAMENTLVPLLDEPGEWSGLCLDVAHLEMARLNRPHLYQDYIRALGKYPVKVAHISTVKGNPPEDFHEFEKESDFSYLVPYKHYLPEVLALELENPIDEQLKAKEFVEKLLR